MTATGSLLRPARSVLRPTNGSRHERARENATLASAEPRARTYDKDGQGEPDPEAEGASHLGTRSLEKPIGRPTETRPGLEETFSAESFPDLRLSHHSDKPNLRFIRTSKTRHRHSTTTREKRRDGAHARQPRPAPRRQRAAPQRDDGDPPAHPSPPAPASPRPPRGRTRSLQRHDLPVPPAAIQPRRKDGARRDTHGRNGSRALCAGGLDRDTRAPGAHNERTAKRPKSAHVQHERRGGRTGTSAPTTSGSLDRARREARRAGRVRDSRSGEDARPPPEPRSLRLSSSSSSSSSSASV